jgi:excisionase family DNA binding protein
MTPPRLELKPTLASLCRRGGARGTGAASGSPPGGSGANLATDAGGSPARQRIPTLQLLLKPEEAAATLGIGRTTVFKLISRGELPAIRIGRTVRVPKVLLEAWVVDRASSAADMTPERSRP